MTKYCQSKTDLTEICFTSLFSEDRVPLTVNQPSGWTMNCVMRVKVRAKLLLEAQILWLSLENVSAVLG